MARFQIGAAEFSEVETSAEGLGPLFNGNSCAQCHNTPVPGGAGLMRVVRAACGGSDSSRYTLVHLFTTRPDLAAAGLQFDCPTVVAQRRTTSLRGAGLIEAISDRDIEAVAEAQPEDLAGRAAYVEDLQTGRVRVGRFGWKAQHATLDSFAGDAYLNELGVTNELFPEEVAPNGDEQLLRVMDPTPDPEAEVGSLGKLADFMRFLAPPTAADDTSSGRAVFDELGCETCHRAEYTASSSLRGLDGATVPLYSDLLLHDVGTGDGIAQGDATEFEIRTPPLWGARHSQFWLHDGRASSLDEAIRLHGGQAARVRDAYARLPSEDRTSLLMFLNSL